jgi:uncharacterized RDD family membrane protein YckC
MPLVNMRPCLKPGFLFVFLCTLVLCWCMPSVLLAADEQESESELTAVGSAGRLWIAVGSSADKGWLQWLYHMDKPEGPVRILAEVGAQKGRIEAAAAVGSSLYVFYDNGAHYRYEADRSRVEIRLPDSVLPESLTGAVVDLRPRLWALVNDRTADLVEAEANERDQAPQAGKEQNSAEATDEQVDGSAETRRSLDEARLPGTLHVVVYEAGSWRPFDAAPRDLDNPHRCWLLADGSRLFLLWTDALDKQGLRVVVRSGHRWQELATLRLPDGVEPASVSYIDGHLAVVGFSADGADADQKILAWRLSVNRDQDSPGSWKPADAFLDQQENELLVSADSTAGTFAGRIALVQAGQEAYEVLLLPVEGGAIEQPAIAIPDPQVPPEPSLMRGVLNMLGVVILGGVVFLVFRRRQESLANPVVLPEGVYIAGIGPRLFAALIDVLPAVGFMLAIWYKPLADFSDELYVAAESGTNVETMPVPTTVIWAWVACRVFYVAYCTLFEWRWAATPGKMLVGCRVASESGHQPKGHQILVRNVTRFVEFEPFLPVWPFYLIVVLTNTRQRIGDLLAHTIVVQGLAIELKTTDQQPEQGESMSVLEDTTENDDHDPDQPS